MQFFQGRILIGMPPVATETVFRLLNYPNYHFYGEAIYPCIGFWDTAKPLGGVVVQRNGVGSKWTFS